jgi:hypothetical protein
MRKSDDTATGAPVPTHSAALGHTLAHPETGGGGGDGGSGGDGGGAGGTGPVLFLTHRVVPLLKTVPKQSLLSHRSLWHSQLGSAEQSTCSSAIDFFKCLAILQLPPFVQASVFEIAV